jgi:UDP-N-acetylglucosamine 1-carboxyvinyltransferase
VDRFLVSGPNRLAGSVTAAGAKNAALPALAATLLTDQPVQLHRVPAVRDITSMRMLLESLGVASTTNANTVVTDPDPGATAFAAPYELVKKMRASVLVLGPLLARRGQARVSLPGGCAIGVRPIDQHLAALEALGATITLEHGYVNASAPVLRGAQFRFAMPTVTGTENTLMAAVLAKGSSRLENCACEPEIVDLVVLLRAMGAQIRGEGTATIEIDGVEALHGAEHAVVGDRIEAGTYLIAAALTGGDVTVEGIDPAALVSLLEVLREVGATVTTAGQSVRVQRRGTLVSADITTAPHPGFPTDLQAQFVALMTQAEGVATVRETVFENRFQHVAELARMGARIAIDGHIARITGPARLTGANVMATDLRASACLVLAALVAEGDSLVRRIYHLDRGYERMEANLVALGARVERVAGPPIPE